MSRRFEEEMVDGIALTILTTGATVFVVAVLFLGAVL